MEVDSVKDNLVHLQNFLAEQSFRLSIKYINPAAKLVDVVLLELKFFVEKNWRQLWRVWEKKPW